MIKLISYDTYEWGYSMTFKNEQDDTVMLTRSSNTGDTVETEQFDLKDLHLAIERFIKGEIE